MKNQIKITLVLLIGLIIGCSKDDDEPQIEVVELETQIALADLETRVDENSASGILLGTLSAVVENTSEAPSYALLNQSLEGAVRLQGNRLLIANNVLYDYETVTKITGQVQASVEDITTTANFTVRLNNVKEYIVSTVLNSQGDPANFQTPSGMVEGVDGSIYVVEQFKHVITKISPDGTVSTLAGNGTSGFTNGSGVNASFFFPQGITLAEDGNLYVTDSGNSSIRKITPNGNVTTLAGTGEEGVKDGEGTNASFDSPSGIVWNPKLKALYVADRGNNSIRAVTLDGIVTTYAGKTGGDPDNVNGVGIFARFSGPTGICVDELGNLYVADRNNNTIRLLESENESEAMVSTYAGSIEGNTDGVFENASFNTPTGLAIDDQGILYVADSNNNLIRSIDSNREVTTVAGSGNRANTNGVGTAAEFVSPEYLMIDASGDLYTGSVNSIKKIAIQ